MSSGYETQLSRVGHGIYEKLVDALNKSRSLGSVFDGVEDAAYVKSTDGQLVLSNVVYDQMFTGSVSAIGRYSYKYLDSSMMHLSRTSDELILNGCDFVEFEHGGRNSAGDTFSMRTFKKSLIGIGHPNMAILGVTRTLKRIQARALDKVHSLADAFREFSGLESRDQQIAISLAQGVKVKQLAGDLNVSEKTIENRRAVIYRALSLDGSAALVKTLVRLQDNGFGDFGL